MRKFFLFILLLSALGSAQTISMFSMGQGKTQLVKSLGEPDLETQSKLVWVTNDRIKIAGVFIDERLCMVTISGQKDSQKRFKSLRGVCLGDKYETVRKSYGKPFREEFDYVDYTLYYKNITFKLKQNEFHELFVVEIVVYQTLKC